MAEKQETKVIFTPENADNKEHRVTASDNSLVDIAPKEGGSVEVTEKGKVGSTHLEAETILDYANENLLKGTDENWVLQSWSGWTTGYMTYTLEDLGVQVGDTLTYSMEIDNTLDYENNTQMLVLVNFYDSNFKVRDAIYGNPIDTGYKGFSSGTKTIPEGTVKIRAYKASKNNSGEGKNKIAKTRHQKLERGSEATPYTKAQSEVEDDPRIKRDSIPVNIKGERTLDFKNKVRGSEEENANRAELDIRDFENRNLLKDTSDVWDTRTWSNWVTARKGPYYISELGLSPGDTITFSAEIDNTLDDENKIGVRFTPRDKNGDQIEGQGSPFVEPGKVGISKQVYTLPENTYYFYLYQLAANELPMEGYTAAFRKTKVEQGDTYTGWSPSAHDLGIPYGQPNLVNHSHYNSRELSEGITELVNDSFLEDTEAKVGDSISSRIRGNLSGYYDGDVLLQGYTKSGANTGEIARKKVNPKTPDQEIWLEEGEIPKDTERLGLYFNRDTDYSMSERNLLLKSGEPQSFKGNGKINQTRDVYYRLTPDLNESYGGENFSFQTDIDVIGYDFGGTLYVQTRPNNYVKLFEEKLRFENHENKLRNPGMDEAFPEGSNLISDVDAYDENIEDWDRWGTVGSKYVNGTRKRKILNDPEDASKKVNGLEIKKNKGRGTNLGYQQNSIAVEANGYYALTLWARKHPDSENDSPMLRVRLGTFQGKDNEILPEIGEEWERLSLILKMPEDTSAITLFIGVADDSYGKVQIARPKFERAEEHHRIEHTKPMSGETLKEIGAVETRADNMPSSLEVTLSNSKWELGDSISPYSQAPEDLDDPGQYSKLENVEIQVIKGPEEAQDDWKPSYVDFYQKTMLQSQARTAIGTPPNLPSLENYTPFKAPKKSLPSSLTYSSVPKFDPKVELPQGYYDKLNTDGESIKAKTKLVGQNAEFTLIFDTVRFTEEAFPELFEGLTEMKDKIDKYHEVAIRQEIFVTARGNNGVEDMVCLKWMQRGGPVWESGSSRSSSSSLSEISRPFIKGSGFWDGRWVGKRGNTQGKSLALLTTKDTDELTEKEVELSKARLEVTIQPPENPDATPKTITVLPEKESE